MLNISETSNEELASTSDVVPESSSTNEVVKESISNDVVKESKPAEDTATQRIRIKKEHLIKTLIPVILRQTDYTEEIARNKLEEHNYDLKQILYEWMDIPLKKDDVICETSNQERYRLIRNVLDGKSI